MSNSDLEIVLNQIDENKKIISTIKPLNEIQVKQLKQYYRIGLTYTSNALEGNSITESETKVILEDGITIGGKPLREIYEVEGHSLAFDKMYDLVSKSNLTEDDIKFLHKLFYERIDKLNAGIYRNNKVIISGSRYLPPTPEKLTELMKKLMINLSKLKSEIHPVLFAAKVHKEFVFIHPFIYGNGRLARLLMNLELLKAGYNITIISPILRAEYISSLEEAHVNEDKFNLFISKCVLESQKEYLRLIS